MNNSLYARLRAHFPDRDKIFIETDAGRRLTYGDLEAGSARLAHALVARGVKPGDRVAVQVQKSPEAILLYLACVRAGAAYLPLNTGYTLAELSYFIGDAEPAIFVCDPKMRDAIAALPAAPQVETLDADGRGTITDAAADRPSTFDDVPRDPDDLAAILYTSGTTGRSKGAMLTQENLASNAEVLVRYWRFTADDVLIHALPIFHTHGLFVATNVVLMAGGSMIFAPRFDADTIVAAMPRATSMMGVPTFYTRLLEHPGLTREATSHMRLFTSGSAPLLADTHRAFEDRTGHRILERYGMTETNMNASNPYEGERRAGTVGFPLPGVEFRVAEAETGRALPQGGTGILEVRGPNVFKGYWRMPEKTAAEFRDDGFFITGDIVRIDDDGYLHIVGRAKDLIISGGYNVYPKEVETEIDALAGVVEFAVIGLPHPDFGEGVAAAIVSEAGAKLEEDAILAELQGRLARYKLPKRVFFVDELPRNTMGKVQKNVLREQFDKVFSAD